MHGKTAFALIGAVAIGQVAAADAPETSGNPPNVAYKATIEEVGFADAAVPGELKGHIAAQAPSDGNGVNFEVHFENLPAEGGPFSYHIHKAPVPADGNCTAASSHLDPYGAGAEITCDKENPQTCEVGDMSGKHGSIEESPFHATYLDLYTSTKEGDEAYFGDLSFVIHYANSTRLACANFMKHEDTHPTGGYPNGTTPHPTGGVPTESPEPEPTSPPPGSAASSMGAWSISALFAGAAAVAFSL